VARAKDQRIGEIEVESNEATVFATTVLDQIAIKGRFQMLLGDGGNVVSDRRKKLLAAESEILVEFELRAEAGCKGTST
jgi:hypothetical protein